MNNILGGGQGSTGTTDANANAGAPKEDYLDKGTSTLRLRLYAARSSVSHH